MGNPNLKTCPYCKRDFSEAEMAARKEERARNAQNSRDKCAANGNSLGRKKIGDPETIAGIMKLLDKGYSIRGIAQLSGVSRGVVKRIIAEVRGKKK